MESECDTLVCTAAVPLDLFVLLVPGGFFPSLSTSRASL